MTRAIFLAVVLLGSISTAHAQGTSITDFGAQPGNYDTGPDNTAAINRCLDAAARDYFHCHKPPGYWHVKGSLRMERETGQMGAGFDGTGVIREDNNNLPILVLGGIGMQAPYIEANLQYTHGQTPDMKNSACIHIDLPKKDNSIYNGWFTIQCTNAYHGIDQKLGSFWGNEVPWLDCKHNSGSCIDLTTNFQAGAPNNHFGHIYVNPVQTACPDGAEIKIEFASNTVFDNLELNNSPCPIFAGQNERGITFRNVRFEHGWITDHKFAGHGLIEVMGDGATIEQYEVQTLTVDVHGDFYLFHDAGGWGPMDQLSGALNLYHPTVKSGRLYGINSPHVVVKSNPFFAWYAEGVYEGDVSPNSPNVRVTE